MGNFYLPASATLLVGNCNAQKLFSPRFMTTRRVIVRRSVPQPTTSVEAKPQVAEPSPSAASSTQSPPGGQVVGTEQEKDKEEDDVSPEERRIKEFQYQTFIVFIVGVSLLLIGLVLLIVGFVSFLRAGQVAPQRIKAPRSITQGLIVFSENQKFWAGFATDLAVYQQSVKPTNNEQVGLVLWQTGIVVPVGSYLSFDGTGTLTIISNGQEIWTNNGDMPPPDQRPPGPYELSVSNEGVLQVTSIPTQQVLWQRPEPGAFEQPAGTVVASPQEVAADTTFYSPGNTVYLLFRKDTGVLGMFQNSDGAAIWLTPAPNPTDPALGPPPYGCVLTVTGNLQITSSTQVVVWSTQTVNLALRTRYFLVLNDSPSLQILKRFYGEAARPYWLQQANLPRVTPYYSLSTGESMQVGVPIQSQNGQYAVVLTAQGNFVLFAAGAETSSTGQTGQIVRMDSTGGGQMIQVNTQTQQTVWSNHTPGAARNWPLSFSISDSGSMLWSDRLGTVLSSSVSLYQGP